MTRKGRRPDNACKEYFFGSMNNEMLCECDWKGCDLEELVTISNFRLEQFRKERMKTFNKDSYKTIYDTIDNRRKKFGLCA